MILKQGIWIIATAFVLYLIQYMNVHTTILQEPFVADLKMGDYDLHMWLTGRTEPSPEQSFTPTAVGDVDQWPPLPPGVPTPISTATQKTRKQEDLREPTDKNPWMNPMPGEPDALRFGKGAAKPSVKGGLPIFRRNFSDKIQRTDEQLLDPNRWAEQHHFYTVPGAGAQMADAAFILNRGRAVPSGIPIKRKFVTV